MKTLFKPGFTATGTVAACLQPGAELDEILTLIRLGVAFRAQHAGRKPGFLHNYIVGLVARMPKPTFDNLLAELDLAAARRDAGDDREPIERVSRSWQIMTYHDPKKGEARVTFGTLRNYMTIGKK